MQSNSCVTASTVCILVVFVGCAQCVWARPRDVPPPSSMQREKFCEENEEQQETCQKCAKITKSPLVYPMCCNNDEGVYNWCNAYVYFGQETSHTTYKHFTHNG